MDPKDHYRNTPNQTKNTGVAKLKKNHENDLFSRRDTGLQDDI